MKKLLASLGILLLLVGCSGNPHIRGSILPPKDGGYVSHSYGNKVEGSWTPTDEQVKDAQSAILSYIGESNLSISNNLQSYRCQYTGIIVNGRKRIFCNFFWFSKEWPEWKSEYVLVFDGGDHYFQLEYDIVLRKCLNFLVNGVA